MRALIIDDQVKADIKRVTDFATKPENYYVIGPDGFSIQKPPGDDPRHVTAIPRGYRAVFSITKEHDRGMWRHLSISVPTEKYPNPYAAYAIAELFGFTGWNQRATIPPPDGWIMNVNEKEHCVVMMQELK